MTTQLSGDQISEFKQIFDIIDDDLGGTISYMALVRVLRSFDIQVNEEEVRTVAKIYGLSSTTINFDDFTFMVSCLCGFNNILTGPFNSNDMNKNGRIGQNDLELAYNRTMNGNYYKNPSGRPINNSIYATNVSENPRPKAPIARTRNTITSSISTTTVTETGTSVVTTTINETSTSSSGGLGSSTLTNSTIDSDNVVRSFIAKNSKNEYTIDEFANLCGVVLRKPPTHLLTHHVYNARFGDVCPYCNRLIKNPTKRIKIDLFYYHPNCAICNVCGDKVQNGQYRLKEDGLYCLSCKKSFASFT